MCFSRGMDHSGADGRAAATRRAIYQRKVESAGGYSLMRDYDGDATFPGGWFASVAADVAGPLAVVGDASGSYKSMGGLGMSLCPPTSIPSWEGRGSSGGPAESRPTSRCCSAARVFHDLYAARVTAVRCAELLRDGSRWRHRHPVVGPWRRPSGCEHPLESHWRRPHRPVPSLSPTASFNSSRGSSSGNRPPKPRPRRNLAVFCSEDLPLRSSQ